MPFKIFDGSSWQPLKKIKVYVNESWRSQEKAFIFDGSSWIQVVDKPLNLTLPTLSYSRGQELYGVGQTVTSTNGTWDANPSSYKYQWEKGIYSGSEVNWS